jgi:DNA-binding beta-propeller fold protein YncE
VTNEGDVMFDRLRHTISIWALGLAVAAGGVSEMACASSADGVPVALPSGSPGIGFDDLRYSSSLGRVLAPGGRSGNLALIDPDSLEVSVVSGFSATNDYSGGHGDGATSVDEGRGFLFVTDRTSRKVFVVDAAARKIVGSAALGAGPDYVRYVAATDELWITEPSADRIEVFALPKTGPMTPVSTATIPVQNGPESLVIDGTKGRAYTHRWQASSVVIDVRTRSPIFEWKNGCASSRGLAVDEARGFFFSGCLEGTVSVLDTRDGRILSSIAKGSGFDVVGYNPKLGHLYLAGTSCACLVVLGVSSAGQLKFLGRFHATGSAHCATADDRGHAWVCDPDGGRVLRVNDPYPASL